MTSLIECKGGQILFSRIRPYLNKITLVPDNVNKAICSQEFYVLSPRYEGAPMGYFWLVLRSRFVLNQIRHLAGGSLRPRIRDEDIADLEIPVLKDPNLLSEIEVSVRARATITDGHITIVRLKPEIRPYYILSYLRCEYARRQLSRMERGTSGQIELYAEDIKNLMVPIPNDGDIIKKAERPVRESLEGMQEAKSILHRTRSKLECSVTNATSVEGEDCPNTIIPEEEWRIIRP